MIPEAKLERTENGLVPQGDGWFVLNARESAWRHAEGRPAICSFEGKSGFPQLGFHVNVLWPGQPMAMYHWEVDQEDFLVLSGEAVLVVEGEERPLQAWDFVHCPPETKHVIVGAGEGPCVVIAVGARVGSTGKDWGGYTVEPAAARHGASVEEDTSDEKVAYASWAWRRPARYRDDWLPDGR